MQSFYFTTPLAPALEAQQGLSGQTVGIPSQARNLFSTCDTVGAPNQIQCNPEP